LNNIDLILKLKSGGLSDQEQNARRAENDNRTIFLMMRFKTIFKDYEEIK